MVLRKTFLVCYGLARNSSLFVLRTIDVFCAGAHPGGGVQGAAGRNCALVVMSDKGKAMHS